MLILIKKSYDFSLLSFSFFFFFFSLLLVKIPDSNKSIFYWNVTISCISQTKETIMQWKIETPHLVSASMLLLLQRPLLSVRARERDSVCTRRQLVRIFSLHTHFWTKRSHPISKYVTSSPHSTQQPAIVLRKNWMTMAGAALLKWSMQPTRTYHSWC
jgi:hypothetical protein